VSDIRIDKKTGVKTIVFDVLDSYKGSPDSEMSMTDAQAGTDCGIDFKEGDSYIVYAHWEWGAVVTSRCYGTKPLESAASDAGALGPSDSAKEKFYSQLQKLCMGRLDTLCCLASIKAMHQGYYLPEPDEGCPTGTVPDRLKCNGSIRWCVPAN
jgi:hypothetical protein